jgi:hypothetical protein
MIAVSRLSLSIMKAGVPAGAKRPSGSARRARAARHVWLATAAARSVPLIADAAPPYRFARGAICVFQLFEPEIACPCARRDALRLGKLAHESRVANGSASLFRNDKAVHLRNVLRKPKVDNPRKKAWG